MTVIQTNPAMFDPRLPIHEVTAIDRQAGLVALSGSDGTSFTVALTRGAIRLIRSLSSAARFSCSKSRQMLLRFHTPTNRLRNHVVTQVSHELIQALELLLTGWATGHNDTPAALCYGWPLGQKSIKRVPL
jgi:hypothetical protein